ncbi:oxygenase MpaB family protein [Ketobacter sp.]|uniref:oxygenase MpaB family protein n=1 Tax=Ketobacter sp. TaxID=2083498 RepID=UPI0025C6AD36|nr:oxygenase MpaB family protein [Ketobacter sp.]
MSDFSFKRLANRGDPLADAVALRIDRRRPSHMMDEVVYLAKTEISVYQEFIDQLNTHPGWLDWEQIEHARRLQSAFHHARSIAIFSGSLLEGYCQNRAAVALVTRGHLHHEVIRRIHEANYLIHSLNQTDSLRSGKPGYRALAELRLSNAMIRKSLTTRGWPEHYKCAPLSQLDLAFDMLEYGYLATQGMERLGIQLDQDDRRAIHHFWRYCSWLYGLDEALITAGPHEERALYRQLSQRQKRVAREHELLAHTTLRCIGEQGLLNIPNELLQSFSRICLGDARANALNITQPPGWRRRAQFYITANRGATFVHYHIPGMSGLNQRIHRYLSRNITVPPQAPERPPRPLQKIA